MRKFQIEQVAICPINPQAAIELLAALGALEWARDHVVAFGEVFGIPAANEADLAFNYSMDDCAKPMEFEVLNYTEGDNWMSESPRLNSVSHFGMHCTEEELAEYKEFFHGRRINIAQEVDTTSHTNPFIDGKRLYHYCIFSTKHILGTDLKFIVRRIL